MLGRHELVAELFRLVLGTIEYLVQLARYRRLRIALLWQTVDLARHLIAKRRHADADLLQNRNDDSFVLLEQSAEQVEIVNDGVAGTAGRRRGLVQRLAGFHGKTVWIDHVIPKSNAGARVFSQSGLDPSVIEFGAEAGRCRSGGGRTTNDTRRENTLGACSRALLLVAVDLGYLMTVIFIERGFSLLMNN
jgi:hypothetical protein